MDRKGVPVGEGVGVPQGKEIAVSDITERMRMKVLWLCNIMNLGFLTVTERDG